MTDRPSPWRDESRLVAPPEADRRSFGAAFERLVGIMARLRGPGGCPWDREQSLVSLKPYLVEESYEVLEAIDLGSVPHHQEELGDLLLQVVFQAELRREASEFDAADVAHGIADKLVRRHPHVFGDAAAGDHAEAFVHWERIKAKEKEGRSVIDGVPRALPSLLRAQRVTEKASRVGFDWTSAESVLPKLDEELSELKGALASRDQAAIRHELGDLLFTVVNLARHLEVSAEDALAETTDRFSRRFQAMESILAGGGKKMVDASAEELDGLWNAVKGMEPGA